MISEESLNKRALAHRGVFRHVFARNCAVRRITSAQAWAFLEKYHLIGPLKGRYHYGLFIERPGRSGLEAGTMVAVSVFSAARTWQKGERKVRSCEWLRAASLPDVRVAGGMGKLLQAFIADAHPDDIMSYADASWSSGAVYRTLGFVPDGSKTFPDGSESLKFRLRITNVSQ